MARPSAPPATTSTSTVGLPRESMTSRDLTAVIFIVISSGSFFGGAGRDTFKHGILRLQSGLKVYLPHFDLFMEGDDWFKYVGKRCWARGILHTYTKNIEGYRGPSLELNDFSGP